MTNDLDTVVSTMDSVFSRQDSPAGWLWQPLLRQLARGEPLTIADLAAATAALNKYFDPASRRTQNAATVLQQAHAERKLYVLFRERIAYYRDNLPDPAWDGVTNFETK